MQSDSVETLFLFEQGFGSKPKKTGHIKPDLIDVDLVRGKLPSSLASYIGCQIRSHTYTVKMYSKTGRESCYKFTVKK